MEFPWTTQQGKNRQNAIDFYAMTYLGRPRQTIEKYVGDEYIQHNHVVGDRIDPFVEYVEKMAAEYPEKTIKFVRSVSDVNLVALHAHQTWPDGDEFVTMNFFRFDDSGEIVEHWDSIQAIPESTENGNSMY